MDVEQKANNLLFTNPTRKVAEAARTAPGNRKFRDGQVWVQGSGINLEHLLAKLPELVESGLPIINDYLGVEAAAERVKSAKREGIETSDGYEFKTTPYQVQREAWEISKDASEFGYFMEMGTGKTKVLLDNAAYLFEAGLIDRAVVLAPKGVHNQWVVSQMVEHLPDRIPSQGFAYYSGLRKKDEALLESMLAKEGERKFQVITFAFESLASKAAQQYIAKCLYNTKTMLILDESHKIKNPSAKRTKFLLKCAPHATYRRIATGTSITNGLEDLFTQFLFLNPMILGHNSYYTFRNEYCHLKQIPGAPMGAMQIVGYRNIEKLQDKVRGCTFQALKKDCLDLPEKTYVKHEVEMTSEQLRVYKALKKEAQAMLGEGTVTTPLAITKLMKMQQVLSGFLIDDDQVMHHLPSKRVDAVLDILSSCRTAIVWCRFRDDILSVKAALEKEGYRVGCYFGDTTEEERHRITQPGEVDVLVANPQSAGTGLNLTHFTTAIFYSNSFNAAERWQAEDRIHRIGQDQKCTYIDLFCPGSIDEKVSDALTKKGRLADLVKQAAIDPVLLMKELENEPF